MTTFKVELFVEIEDAEEITVDGIVAKDQLETALGKWKYNSLSHLQDFKIRSTRKVEQLDPPEFLD